MLHHGFNRLQNVFPLTLCRRPGMAATRIRPAAVYPGRGSPRAASAGGGRLCLTYGAAVQTLGVLIEMPQAVPSFLASPLMLLVSGWALLDSCLPILA